jgi:hypothetical protein
MGDATSVWKSVPHHGGAWEPVRRVCKLADPFERACRRVEAWTAVISLDLDSERLICRLERSVVGVQCQNGLRGDSVNWLRQKLSEELAARLAGDGGHRKERRRKSGILLGAPTTRRSPEGALENVKDVY